MAASEGECPAATYEQLMEMERRNEARLAEAVKALTRALTGPTNFMTGTTAGAMLVNILSGIILIWCGKAACYLGKLTKARFRIKSFNFLHNQMRKQKNGESTDHVVIDVNEAAAAYVASSIPENCSNTLTQEKTLRKRISLKDKKQLHHAEAHSSCEEVSTSNGCPDSLEIHPDSSEECPASMSVFVGMRIPSATVTVVDEQAQDLQKLAADILPPHSQLHPLQPGSVFLSATVSVASNSAVIDLLHRAKRLFRKGLQLDPHCTVQVGDTDLLYSTSGENMEHLSMKEGVYDVPIITSAQKFGKKTILIKGLFLKDTEIKAITSFEKSVCLNLVYYQELADGVDLLLVQSPQGELLHSESFVYANRTICVPNCTHPLVLRSKHKEVDTYTRKSTVFGTLCKRQFWISLVLLYIFQIVVFQPWKELSMGLIFQLIISFFSSFLAEYITIPWKFNLCSQWLEFMIRLTNLDNILALEESSDRSIMEMEWSKSKLTLSESNIVIAENAKRETKNTSNVGTISSREIKNSDDKKSIDDSKGTTSLQKNDGGMSLSEISAGNQSNEVGRQLAADGAPGGAPDPVESYEKELSNALQWAGTNAVLCAVSRFLALCNLTWASVVLQGVFTSDPHPRLVQFTFANAFLLLLEVTRVTYPSLFTNLPMHHRSPDPCNIRGNDQHNPRAHIFFQTLQFIIILPSLVIPSIGIISIRVHYDSFHNFQISLCIFYIFVTLSSLVALTNLICSVLAFVSLNKPPEQSILRYYDKILENAMSRGPVPAVDFDFFSFAYTMLGREIMYSRVQSVENNYKKLIYYLYAHRLGVDYLQIYLDANDAFVQLAAAHMVAFWVELKGSDLQLPEELLRKLADKLGTGQVGLGATSSFGALACTGPGGGLLLARTVTSKGRSVMDRLADLVDATSSRSLLIVRTLARSYEQLCVNKKEAPKPFAEAESSLVWKLKRLAEEAKVHQLRVQAAYLLKMMGEECDPRVIEAINPWKDSYWLRSEVEMLSLLIPLPLSPPLTIVDDKYRIRPPPWIL